jgi:hypothetical protein
VTFEFTTSTHPFQISLDGCLPNMINIINVHYPRSSGQKCKIEFGDVMTFRTPEMATWRVMDMLIYINSHLKQIGGGCNSKCLLRTNVRKRHYKVSLIAPGPNLVMLYFLNDEELRLDF